MTRSLAIATAFVFVSCGSVLAQVSSSAPAPLGITSPLGIGPAPAVPGTGIPLGATEFNSPGVSPMTSGVSPLGSAPLSTTTCAGINSLAGGLSGGAMTGSSVGSGISAAGTSASSMTFDGGGNVGTASGTCGSITGTTSGQAAASASSPTMATSSSSVGRVGIPMGSTELGVGGLSPLPQIPTVNPSAPSSILSTPCATTGIGAMGTTTGGTLTGSC
jgi:hypothetical protein